jgi:hypothetical protein
MILYKDTEEGPLQLESLHDPSEILDYTIYYSAPVRVNATKYLLGEIVYPATRTGIYLLCVQPGITAASEPTISTVKNTQITDGTVKWKVVHDTLILKEGEVIFSSSWAATESVPTTSSSFANGYTIIYAGPVPAGVTSFILTNTIVTDASPARTYERSIEIQVKTK